MDRVILLVEDDPDDAELAVRALKKLSATKAVVVVRDGVEALDYIFGTGDYQGRDPEIQPAVILLDLKLPKIDGFEILRRLKTDERTRAIPVVVLTSSNEEKDIIDCYRLGANSYVRKLVDFSWFGEAIQQLGLYWTLMNEPPPVIKGK